MDILNSLFGSSTPVLLAVVLGVTLICWVLGSIGIFKISKKLAIKGSAVCFIPFLTPFCIARIAEKKETESGIKIVSSKTVLALLLAEKFVAVLLFGAIFFAKSSIEKAALLAIEQDVHMQLSAFWPAIPVIVAAFVLLAIAIIYTVLYFKSLWGAFSLLDKNRAVLWLLLSIIFQNRFCNVWFLFLKEETDSYGFYFEK